MDVRLPARCPGDPCHQPEWAWAARRSRKERRGRPERSISPAHSLPGVVFASLLRSVCIREGGDSRLHRAYR